jgi:hypothetical protein
MRPESTLSHNKEPSDTGILNSSQRKITNTAGTVGLHAFMPGKDSLTRRKQRYTEELLAVRPVNWTVMDAYKVWKM